MATTIRDRAGRIHATQRTRADYVVHPSLTDDQYEAARLGHPGLTADEAAYYVHESERYLYDLELWSRDAMPEDGEAQRQFERVMYAAERRAPGGRIRHAISRRESDRYRASSRRYQSARAAEWADCPF